MDGSALGSKLASHLTTSDCIYVAAVMRALKPIIDSQEFQFQLPLK